MGPKLFMLCINDICSFSHVLKFILFADYTNVLCSGSDIVQLSIIVINELDKLNEWVAFNKLSLNLSEYNVMLFTNCRREHNVNISINNCEIDMVYKTKFLGVVIDSKLNWNDHVAMVKKNSNYAQRKTLVRQKIWHDIIFVIVSSISLLVL